MNSEKLRIAKNLRRVADQYFTDIEIWLALLEDQLRRALPDNSAVLARFSKLKESAASDGAGAADMRVRSEAKNLAEAVASFLEADPLPPDDLKEEVERIIQNGYFQSSYFRAILGGFGVVLVLITGVGTLKINEQVQAMQRILDQAKSNLDAAKKEAADNNNEAAKARSEVNNRQAEMALLVLQGNADLVKLRTNAMTEMSKAEDAFRAEAAERTQHWQSAVEGIISAANQKVREAGEEGKTSINNKADEAVRDLDKDAKARQQALLAALLSRVRELEAAKSPWVPRIVWSMSKAWIFAPLALLFSVLAWILAAARFLNLRPWISGFSVGIGVLAMIGLFVVWFRL